MHDGLAKLKAIGADVILVDLQFCPKVIAKVDADDMVNLISITAKKENVGVFRRFAVMKHWRQVARIPYDKFLSPDRAASERLELWLHRQAPRRLDRRSLHPRDADRRRRRQALPRLLL